MWQQEKKDIFINRELSWLEFDRRVLSLAQQPDIPLGEQLNFAAIYASNLDEFFMIRVGTLYDQTLLKSEIRENKTGMTAQEQLNAIMQQVASQQCILDECMSRLYVNLDRYNLHKVDFSQLSPRKLELWREYFVREIYPVLSPQIVDGRHPFPFLRNMEIYVGALVKDPRSEHPVFGLIPVSTHFERLHFMAGDNEESFFALVEELVLQFADVAFGQDAVLEKCLFRVTRNADISMEEGMFDHDVDYREVMSELLKERRKLAAVRLQFQTSVPLQIKALLQEKLMLPDQQCFVRNASLDLGYLRKLAQKLHKMKKESLFYPRVKSLKPPHGYNLTQEVRDHDVLMFFPYQNIQPLIRMLFEAAYDPDVVSIKMTLYRVAHNSKVIEALVAAAENGKEVVTVVELRARFDEQNNIRWSRELEEAGCTVIYGFSDYKIHAKIALITRKTGKTFEYISQIGTGNYNEETSELYTDLAYLTSKPEVGEELAVLFNDLAMERLSSNMKHLLVAPLCFKTVLMQEIQQEIEYQRAGGNAHIFIKCNALSDKTLIEALCDASQENVPVEMIVRGICCLRAGVPGQTENILVRSLIGRYLEHARIYCFGSGARMRVYIASGDFLTRNTERRVEVGIRVDDDNIKQMLRDILEIQLDDNINASAMQPDGSYVKQYPTPGARPIDGQMAMYSFLRPLYSRINFGERRAGTKKISLWARIFKRQNPSSS